MFSTAPILWLQSWASPALTRIMEVISWFGYTRTAIACAVLVAFAVRLRTGMVLLVLLGLNAIATDVAKTAAALPRPFVVDRAVVILGWPAPESNALGSEGANAADSETGFGFPSGHVSTTATFVAGLAGLTRSRWMRATGLGWLALMAMSRLYLGRHFVADLLGGLAVAVVVVSLGMWILRLSDLARSPISPEGRRAALISALVAAALLATALIWGRPDLGDAARLAGIATAVLLLTHLGIVHLPPGALARARLVLTAAVAYGVVWGALTFFMPPSPAAASTGRRLAFGALPAFAMLAAPGVSLRRKDV